MVKIYSYEAGKTLDSHTKFLKKLTKKGARKVTSPEQSDAIIIFCPIVSRFETDITSAIDTASSKIPNLARQKVIMVAMHHTFDKNYIVPNNREPHRGIALLVHCLFHERLGLLSCPSTKKAYIGVRKELGLSRHGVSSCVRQ